MLGALEAVEHLLGRGFQPRRTVYLAFGHDEELDGPRGAGKISELLAERGVHLAFTFPSLPTSLRHRPPLELL